MPYTLSLGILKHDIGELEIWLMSSNHYDVGNLFIMIIYSFVYYESILLLRFMDDMLSSGLIHFHIINWLIQLLMLLVLTTLLNLSLHYLYAWSCKRRHHSLWTGRSSNPWGTADVSGATGNVEWCIALVLKARHTSFLCFLILGRTVFYTFVLLDLCHVFGWPGQMMNRGSRNSTVGAWTV